MPVWGPFSHAHYMGYVWRTHGRHAYGMPASAETMEVCRRRSPTLQHFSEASPP